MKEKDKTREELLAEVDELKLRLTESEETLEAIQSGEVDALIVDTPAGSQTFTIESADYIYRVLIEQMNQGVAILTPDLTIYYCNSQLASMTKIPLEKMMGRKITDFVPEDKFKRYQPFNKMSIKNYKEETTLKTKDGIILPIDLFTQFLEDSKTLYVIITDLSYYKLTEEQLEERTTQIEEAYQVVKENEMKLQDTINELERSNMELQSFAYITSHDLQEPLRSIASYAQLIKRRYEGELDSDADDFIEYMVSGATRLQSMIKGLLEYSRLDTQGEEFKDFNAEEALNNALNHLNSSIEESHVEVIYNPLPVVHGDESQISRVFQNLIGNAIKFKKPQFPPKIHISAQKDTMKNEYVFSVQDNGIGMEKQYSDRIFEVFKRLHPIGEYEGTGIGLAIVMRIIERHGGRVWVESEFGEGSTFYFTIPIVELT